MGALLELVLICFLIYLMLVLNGTIQRGLNAESPCLRGSL